MLGSVHLDDGEYGNTRRHARQRNGDRRKHGVVADHEVPVGLGVGRVGAAGSRDLERVAWLGLRCPRSSDAPIAVDDEVEREQTTLGVPSAHRVGPHPVSEPALDVVVGERPDGEALEIGPSHYDPDHAWG